MKFNRRKFLETITASAAGSVFLGSLTGDARGEALLFDPAARSEYLLADGLTYLNTGTMGPCRRETVEESMRMWEELESMAGQASMRDTPIQF